jgi:hypothetical protein
MRPFPAIQRTRVTLKSKRFAASNLSIHSTVSTGLSDMPSSIVHFMPAEKTYEKIYPTQWKAIQAAAQQYGIRIETANGKASSFGVTLKWDWNYRVSADREPTLRIEILDAGILTQDEALGFVGEIISNAIS